MGKEDLKENENEPDGVDPKTEDEDPAKKMNKLETGDVDRKREEAKAPPRRGRKPVSKSLTMSELPAIPPRGETLKR